MKKTAWAVLACGIALPAAPALAGDRAGTWDSTIRLTNIFSDSHSVHGSKADTDNTVGIGFGFFYNFDDSWALGGVFDWANVDYDADVHSADGSSSYRMTGSIDVASLALNGTYYFASGPISPFVTVQAGATFIDTDVPNGPPQNVCWWDPWWGYYCGTVVPTRSDTEFGYGAGIGLRWDLSQTFFLRGQLAEQWVNIGGDVGTVDSTAVRIEAGWNFY